MPPLDAVLPQLRCPVRPDPLERHGASLVCPDGHSFDIARQGYVNLAVGRHHGTGDDADMVAARDRFLSAGHYAAVTDALVDAVPDPGDGLILDLAGGTGHYAAPVLDAHRDAPGLLVDLSPAALRRAARAHPRLAAIGADAWHGLPLADDSVTVILSVFGPRPAAEIRRVLRPGGSLVVVSPEPDHLSPLVDSLGLVTVATGKHARLRDEFGDPEHTATLRRPIVLPRAAAQDVVAMGPSARHLTPDRLAGAVAALPDPVTITVSVRIARYRP